MRRLILQPASNREAAEHYETTIANPVQLSRIDQFLTSDLRSSLRDIYGSRPLRLWGATPGRDNKVSYAAIQPGDVALFYQHGRFVSSLVVTLNPLASIPRLARDLWGTVSPDDPTTWELVFFLDEFRDEDIPYAKVWNLIRQGPHDALRGLTIVDPPTSEQVIEQLGLGRLPTGSSNLEANGPATSGLQTPPTLEGKLEQLAELDATRSTAVRLEQAILRTHVFGRSPTGSCSLCGEVFPIELMVAAHIKRRADCSPEDKRDIRNLMPVCKFGCDELFERGYLVVRDGKVVDGPRNSTLTSVKTKVSWLRGKPCKHWTADNAKFFAHHERAHKASTAQEQHRGR